MMKENCLIWDGIVVQTLGFNFVTTKESAPKKVKFPTLSGVNYPTLRHLSNGSNAARLLRSVSAGFKDHDKCFRARH